MTDFLTRAGWPKASQTPLAGDASARRYRRLAQGNATAILMQDPGGDTALFARLARHLTELGLSAPRIMAEDHAQGLLLIEDLGDALFARLMVEDPAREIPLYLAATDVLVALHQHAPPADLPRADPATLAQMTDLAFDWYLLRATGKSDPAAKAASIDALYRALTQHAADADVMILRDYHAENLIWLRDRAGPARVGLLDFQDALQGHRAYDLASLITDARRDVSPAAAETAIRHYLGQTGLGEAPFRAALATLGVQRNLRILGVFARLAAHGKPQYIDLIPRVWGHLLAGLAHPALAKLAPILRAALPGPEADVLHRLRCPCPTP